MAIILALPKLFDDVVARFAAELGGSAPPQSFGWREPAKTTGKSRIVWVPGNDGELGELGPAKRPGGNPRPLATLGELFTVYLEGFDAAAPETERAQYIAARLLFDAWWRAVYLARLNVTLVSAAWVGEKVERRRGATIRAVCRIEAMVPDAVQEGAPVDTGAQIATSELNVTEATIASAPVQAATTGPVPGPGLQVIDGVVLDVGDRVLVKDEADPAENGIYIVQVGPWIRDPAFDSAAEFPRGLLVFVGAGTANGHTEWVLTSTVTTLGTDPVTFAKVQP